MMGIYCRVTETHRMLLSLCKCAGCCRVLLVYFCKYATKYGVYLQKTIFKDSILQRMQQELEINRMLQLQVYYCKCATKYRVHLQKEIFRDRISATRAWLLQKTEKYQYLCSCADEVGEGS